MSCAIIVLNYNGQEHLRHLLPTLQQAVAAHDEHVPIVVVDNRSTKGDAEYLATNFPDVEVIVAEKNDFLFSLNAVIERRSEEVVILMNNDMRVEPNFIAPLLECLRDPTVFMVAPAVFNWDGSQFTTGQRVPQANWFWFTERYDEASVTTSSFTLEGGTGAFRRSQFVELGGFDPLFRPGYWEDVDISYRGWLRGWSSVYEPRSVIYHRVSGTFGKQKGLGWRLYYRNRTLFVLKNVKGWFFALGYLARFVAQLGWAIVGKQNWTQVRGMLEAIPKMPLAFKRRMETMPQRQLSFDQIQARILAPLSRSYGER